MSILVLISHITLLIKYLFGLVLGLDHNVKAVVSADTVVRTLLLSLALTDMTDPGQIQPSKGRSKGIFKGVKKWLSISSERRQSIDPVMGASAAPSQQGVFHASLSPG